MDCLPLLVIACALSSGLAQKDVLKSSLSKDVFPTIPTPDKVKDIDSGKGSPVAYGIPPSNQLFDFGSYGPQESSQPYGFPVQPEQYAPQEYSQYPSPSAYPSPSPYQAQPYSVPQVYQDPYAPQYAPPQPTPYSPATYSAPSKPVYTPRQAFSAEPYGSSAQARGGGGQYALSPHNKPPEGSKPLPFLCVKRDITVCHKDYDHDHDEEDHDHDSPSYRSSFTQEAFNELVQEQRDFIPKMAEMLKSVLEPFSGGAEGRSSNALLDSLVERAWGTINALQEVAEVMKNRA